MHVVVGALLVRDRTVLLAHRSPAKRWYPDVWDVVGGHVDPGETPAQALTRELGEEVGVVPTDLGDPLARIVDPTGQGGGLDIRIWVVRTWAGEPSNLAPEEHDDLRWFTVEQTRGLRLAHRLLGPLVERVLAPGGDHIG
ncbi:NUDIX domain-containing protein [Jatrophihabitans sp. YIM 134969]